MSTFYRLQVPATFLADHIHRDCNYEQSVLEASHELVARIAATLNCWQHLEESSRKE